VTEAGEQSEDSDRGVEIEASGESDGRQEREELGGRDLEDIQHLRDIIKERESCWKTENPHFSRINRTRIGAPESPKGQNRKGRCESDPWNPAWFQLTAWTRSQSPKLPEEAPGCTSSSCSAGPTRAGG